jgi:hypothetical protein
VLQVFQVIQEQRASVVTMEYLVFQVLEEKRVNLVLQVFQVIQDRGDRSSL